MVTALAIDIGSASVRTALVYDDGTTHHVHHERLETMSRQPGEVELDAEQLGKVVVSLANATLADGGGADVVGIANQRATTVIVDTTTGRPVGPALGWQDLRTVIDCLVLQEQGLRLAPNQSATKAAWLVKQSGQKPESLRFATLDTYVANVLSRGDLYLSDHSNAGVTGLVSADARHWDDNVLSLLGLASLSMPEIVSTMGSFGVLSALPGEPTLTTLVGDQSASLFGQSCIAEGATKITLGTGAMLDQVRGTTSPHSLSRFASGCFATVARSSGDDVVWALEGIILSAASCVDWLRDDLGIIRNVDETSALAQSIASNDGVHFVPAFVGLGTPVWDFGARGGFFGLTRGTTKAHLVRAVLEGIAQRCVDLVDAARDESGVVVEELRVDGGMSTNDFLLQSLADLSGAQVAASKETEATTRGAGLMALVGAGALTLNDVGSMWQPARVFAPSLSDDERQRQREQWLDVRSRVERSVPELSTVSF